ncbi:uncharacterized protein LOC119888114 isoform X2 [Micropterus salmoides]|uniref:uncharacterized protein LOC119888114 isoform X2 n=2 Tax=Micropterus salmoides TaxID=27706 RepID=UPI0018ECF784|nr:uncharacterized protein LOC119888114 isoform X2 [Micropterus salmoides]
MFAFPSHTQKMTLKDCPVCLLGYANVSGHMKEVHGVTDREERRLMLGMASGRYGGPLCCPEMRCRGREFTRLDCHLNTVHKMAKDKRTEVLMKQRRAAIFSRLNQIKKKRKEVEVIQQSLMSIGQGVDNLHTGKKIGFHRKGLATDGLEKEEAGPPLCGEAASTAGGSSPPPPPPQPRVPGSPPSVGCPSQDSGSSVEAAEPGTSPLAPNLSEACSSWLAEDSSQDALEVLFTTNLEWEVDSLPDFSWLV